MKFEEQVPGRHCYPGTSGAVRILCPVGRADTASTAHCYRSFRHTQSLAEKARCSQACRSEYFEWLLPLVVIHNAAIAIQLSPAPPRQEISPRTLSCLLHIGISLSSELQGKFNLKFFSFWANSFFSQYGTFPWGGWTDQVAGCLAVAWLERAQCWASCPPPHWSCSPGLLYLSSRATLPNVRWPSALHSYRRCHRNTGIQATAPGAGPPVREPLESFTRKGRFRHFYLDMSDCLAEWGGEYVSPSLVTTALLSTLFSIGPALVIK